MKFKQGDLVSRDRGIVLTVRQAEPDSGGAIVVMDDGSDEYYLVQARLYSKVGTVDDVRPTERGTSLVNARRLARQSERLDNQQKAMEEIHRLLRNQSRAVGEHEVSIMDLLNWKVAMQDA